MLLQQQASAWRVFSHLGRGGFRCVVLCGCLVTVGCFTRFFSLAVHCPIVSQIIQLCEVLSICTVHDACNL